MSEHGLIYDLIWFDFDWNVATRGHGFGPCGSMPTDSLVAMLM